MKTMSENNPNEPKLTGHLYDGIQEYDNPLPNWWMVTFIGTMIFSFIYYIHYTFGGGPTLAEELVVEMKALPQVATSTFNNSELEQKMAALGGADGGRQVYSSKCASCHGPDGQGLIGPNLADRFWIHGQGTRADLMRVISDGVLDKGMPAWGTMISESDILSVAAYVYSIRGSQPANPKPPQGREVKY
jgi:cytochrome c oxidase cbb3-type subunit III